MGGTTEPIITALKDSYSENAELADAVGIAVDALRAGISSNSSGSTPAAEPRTLGPSTLEVAILDANRPRRAFRRITGSALESLLPKAGSAPEETADAETPEE